MAEAAEQLIHNPFEIPADKLELVGDESPQTEAKIPEPLDLDDFEKNDVVSDSEKPRKVGRLALKKTSSERSIRYNRRRGRGGWWSSEKSCSSCGSGRNRAGVSFQPVGCPHCGGSSNPSKQAIPSIAA